MSNLMLGPKTRAVLLLLSALRTTAEVVWRTWKVLKGKQI